MHGSPPESAEGLESIGGSTGVLLELDHDSNVVWEYRDLYMHHDFQRLPNGNTLIVRWEKLPADVALRVQGGHVATDDPEWMWGDTVREIDPKGSTVREWRSWEHLSTDSLLPSNCPLEAQEWTHRLTPTAFQLLSFRLTNTVVIVDGATGDVRWRWGAGVLSHQHHASWLDNDCILHSGCSGCHQRAPSFHGRWSSSFDTKVVWSYMPPVILGFYSFMVSGCERLPNGNTFITEGATGRLFEVTADGETVWEYVSPWILPSRYGPTTVVFRAYRLAESDPRLEGLALSPAPYRELDERIAAYEDAFERTTSRRESAPAARRKTRVQGRRKKVWHAVSEITIPVASPCIVRTCAASRRRTCTRTREA